MLTTCITNSGPNIEQLFDLTYPVHIKSKQHHYTCSGRVIISHATSAGPNSIIIDLPSVLILIIADQLLNNSLCCSNKYKIDKLSILLSTILIKLFEKCIILQEINWSKSKPD